MQWLLLIAGVVSSLCVVNAARPRRGRWSGVPGFFGSWLTIELAFHWFVLDVVIAAISIAGGGFDHLAGKLGLLLLAQSAVGLLSLGREGLRAEGQMREALVDLPPALSASASASASNGTAHFPWIHVVLPVLMQRRKSVRRVRNLEFAQVGGKTLRLDLTLPEETQPGDKRPVVLQVHGGGWVIGDKRDQGHPLLNHLATQGWVCVNANYRLSPGATFPEHLVDCKRALAWIRAHVADFGGDPDYVCVTGGSAGGHLAALMALTANQPQYQPGFETVDTSLHAAVPFYGCYDFTNRLGTYPTYFLTRLLEPIVMKAFLADEPERFAAASPIDQVREDAPPFLVLHGDRDSLIPLPDTRLFVDRLREVSRQPVFYAELKGAQHGFDIFPSVRTARVVEGVERFLTTLWHHRADPPLQLPAGQPDGERQEQDADEEQDAVTTP
jgi:acetyl esterase/lipase